MLNDKQVITIMLVVMAIWQIGLGAAVAALLHIHFPRVRARKRMAISSIGPGLYPTVVFAIGGSMGVRNSLAELTMGSAIGWVICTILALPGAVYVTRQLGRGQNPPDAHE